MPTQYDLWLDPEDDEGPLDEPDEDDFAPPEDDRERYPFERDPHGEWADYVYDPLRER